MDYKELAGNQILSPAQEGSFDAAQLGSIFGIDLDLTPRQLEQSEEKEERPWEIQTIALEDEKKRELENQKPDLPFDWNNLTGEDIRALREMAGLTPWELASKLNVKTESIYRWERSDRTKLQYDSKAKVWNFQKKLLKSAQAKNVERGNL